MHFQGIFINHATGKIFLYNMGATCNMKSVLCNMKTELCNMRTALCDIKCAIYGCAICDMGPLC